MRAARHRPCSLQIADSSCRPPPPTAPRDGHGLSQSVADASAHSNCIARKARSSRGGHEAADSFNGNQSLCSLVRSRGPKVANAPSIIESGSDRTQARGEPVRSLRQVERESGASTGGLYRPATRRQTTRDLVSTPARLDSAAWRTLGVGVVLVRSCRALGRSPCQREDDKL
jgi:hypothetical protein